VFLVFRFVRRDREIGVGIELALGMKGKKLKFNPTATQPRALSLGLLFGHSLSPTLSLTKRNGERRRDETHTKETLTLTYTGVLVKHNITRKSLCSYLI
jgi:hypothetical protein